MKKTQKNKLYKILLLSGDVLLLASILPLRLLSSHMLSEESVCVWLRYGLKCATCGGTHFVESITSGHLISAFNHNQYLFLLLVFLLLSYLLLHLWVFFRLDLAKKILRALYNLPALIVHLGVIALFVFIRNVGALAELTSIIISLITS